MEFSRRPSTGVSWSGLRTNIRWSSFSLSHPNGVLGREFMSQLASLSNAGLLFVLVKSASGDAMCENMVSAMVELQLSRMVW
eukprot:1143234-Pyramimonas_sp.AAC.1